MGFAPSYEDDQVPARVLQIAIETMLEELSPNLWENSLDRLVDYGHAVGQDLEMAALGTKDELLHGEAVAIDMALSTCLSQHIGLITKAERDRTLSMLRNCQLPVWSPVQTYELFKEAVDNRVKNSMGQRFPLPAGIGKGKIVNDISNDDLRSGFLLWEELCRKPSDSINDHLSSASDQFLAVKKPEPKKPVERLEAADVSPPSAPLPTFCPTVGNLVHYNDTWQILRPGTDWNEFSKQCDCG